MLLLGQYNDFWQLRRSVVVKLVGEHQTSASWMKNLLIKYTMQPQAPSTSELAVAIVTANLPA